MVGLLSSMLVTAQLMRIQAMDRFRQLACVALALGFLPAADAAERPHIVLIMADDLGYECLGCNGGMTYETPHLDALAASGLRFTNCLSTPKCSPSRVTMMTGRYTIRTTLDWGVLPVDEKTFGHMLQEAGYATALAGKWQMGRIVDDPARVATAGFAESAVWAWHEGPRYWQPMIYHNDQLMGGTSDRYGPDVYCDFLIDFISEQVSRQKPFLAYYPMALTHFPKRNEPKGPNGAWESFGEMVRQMDRQVGKLVAALEQQRIRDKTLILFTADNGTPNNVTSQLRTSAGEVITIRGGKAKLTDAGTRVPLIASWPGVIAPGRVSDQLIDFTDFAPTLTTLAGAKLPAGVTIDGQSFAWVLRGQTGTPRQWVFTEWAGKRWVRDQRFKLYEDGKLFEVPRFSEEKKPLGVEDAVAKAARERLSAVLEALLASVQR